MKNTLKIVSILTLLFLASCGNDKSNTIDNRPTVNVKVSTPASENGQYISASGKIEAVQNANLSTRNMGYVNNVHVNVGDKVKQGQLLISINSSDISAQKAQVDASIVEATVALNNAEKDFLRYKALFAENSASQKEMDDMTANFEMSKARLESAKQMKNQVNAQLSYSNITAPFSGIITGKYINKGDMANPGMPLISMETPGSFQVIAMIPESQVSKISTNTTVNVLVKSVNQLISGKVTEISSSAKNTGGQYLAKIILDKTDANILSGMFATVQFSVENNTSSTVLIPTSAIVTNGSLKGIYTISEQNTAILRWLRFGAVYGDQVEVLSGLNANEQYIVSADGKLANGVKINIQ
jgi:RND family efflux transporter MFP subunit